MGARSWKSRLLRKIHHVGNFIVPVIMAYALFLKPKQNYEMAGLEIMIYATIPALLLTIFYTVITFIEWRALKIINK